MAKKTYNEKLCSHGDLPKIEDISEPNNFQARMDEAKKTIQKKDQLKQKYKKAFEIIKKHIDELDPMGLIEWSAPPDEYECEVAEIIPVALRTTDINELADWIIKVFDNAFSEHNLIKSPKAIETATKILDDLIAVKSRFDYTWILTKEQLKGTCYYEFQSGKHKIGTTKHRLENSIYFDMDGIGIFSLFLKEFSPYGITYMNGKDINDFIEKLMCLYNLLDDGKTTLEALKEMDFYKFINANSFEEFIVNAEKVIVKNTAKALADWLTENLKEYKEISLLGI